MPTAVSSAPVQAAPPPPRAARWSRRDVALAAGVAVIQLFVALVAWRHFPADHPWTVLSTVLELAGPAALLFRRRAPVPVLGVALGASLAYLLAGYGAGPLFPALIVAFFSAVIVGRRVPAAGSLVIGYAGFLWLRPTLGWDPAPTFPAEIGLAAWLLVLFAAAEALRARRERTAEAEHLREVEARRRVSEERLRIARELHDVLAHNISLINVQAATALHRAERNEEHAYQALATIKKVSQETLIELRSLLGAMREIDEEAPRAPAPSLARLHDLVASAAAAGVDAQVSIVGAPRPLPASVDLAAYRILQEALTNVARHAGTGRADVVVDYQAGALVLVVEDDGSARAPVAAGTGLTGMTERAAALGGNLDTTVRSEGGLRVRASLPLAGAER